MNKAFSVYLDAVRFLAAMGVVASHFVYVRWTGGAFPAPLIDAVFLTGADFVMVFFVLSGFVIAYTVDVKDNEWRSYAFNRATRIYSVVIPAILLTFALDRIGLSFNAADYDGWWYADHSLWELLARGLTFSNEFWRWPFRLGSNGPYWSLGYEVWYYVLFGVFVFARGWARIAVLALIAAMVGPGVLMLAPIWILGVILFRGCRLGWFSPDARGSSAIIGAVAAIAPIVIYFGLRASGADEALSAASHALLSRVRYLGGVGDAARFLWFWTVGALVVFHFAGVAMLAERFRTGVSRAVSTPVRWLAGASFSIYIIHYPVMQALDAVWDGETSSGLRAAALGVSTIGLCIFFAALFERRLPAFRAGIRALAGSAAPPTRAADVERRAIAPKAAKSKSRLPNN
ncbi:MAG: acyltransferase [Pseudomonadota bacterium]